MKSKNKMWLVGVAILAVLLFLPGAAFGATTVMSTAIDLVASLEGFSATPYWDVSRYSWGYGTAAPGATGTISEADAKQALQEHLQSDYDYLQGLVTVPLSTNQWAALLSFSYNEGPGNADNLVDNINNQDNTALEVQWKKYVLAGGVTSDTLVSRRAREWQMWAS